VEKVLVAVVAEEIAKISFVCIQKKPGVKITKKSQVDTTWLFFLFIVYTKIKYFRVAAHYADVFKKLFA
jgi:hypothetical protein